MCENHMIVNGHEVADADEYKELVLLEQNIGGTAIEAAVVEQPQPLIEDI